MFTKFTALYGCIIVGALGATLWLSPAAYAQRDAGAKARGEYGTGFWGQPQRSVGSMRSYAPRASVETRRSYSYEPAQTRRSYSYEPAISGGPSAVVVESHGCGCGQAAVEHHPVPIVEEATPQATVAQPPTGRRTYSYEPALPAQPQTRSYGGSIQPKKNAWQYPKSDPRRYRH